MISADDSPLRLGTSLQNDRLSRSEYAKSAANAPKQISATSGLVLAVEGPWGSGKTSTLAMIEETLLQTPNAKPVIVHFNPWLVGDRDALLGLFLGTIATALNFTDHVKDSKKVAKELTAYSKAFEVLKFIPGIEPWASILKSLFEAFGAATDSISEFKMPDIEQRKEKLALAVSRYPVPILVFIDDIDRLFPAEVFEMVRIIKAVGGLPNIGYVVAWDANYVASALESAGVPKSELYLDKIVQIRLPLPTLSLAAKGRLINDAVESLPPAALLSHFANDKNRLHELYFSGLRELLEQPRDVTRVFNTVSIIEPTLRGEIAFADIVGLSALMVKAPKVFEAIRSEPQIFVGRMPNDFSGTQKSDDLINGGKSKREIAINANHSSGAVTKLVNYLFPGIPKAEGQFRMTQVRDVEGHIAHPARLMVALQLFVSAGDVSTAYVRQYLVSPTRRSAIEGALSEENCFEFLIHLGDFALALGGQGISDLESLSISVGRLIDSELFSLRTQNRRETFGLRSDLAGYRSINDITLAVDRTAGSRIAQALICDTSCLSLSALIISESFGTKNSHDPSLIASASSRQLLLTKFADHVLAAAVNNTLLKISHPTYVLLVMSRFVPKACKKVFKAIKAMDPSLDNFALTLLKHSFDSEKGQSYALPSDISELEAFCSIASLRKLAAVRLKDPSLSYPARAAWRSVMEAKNLYGVDGSECRR